MAVTMVGVFGSLSWLDRVVYFRSFSIWSVRIFEATRNAMELLAIELTIIEMSSFMTYATVLVLHLGRQMDE